VPSVPLEGSDTVQGLQTIDRLRAAELLDTSATQGRQVQKKRSRRSKYTRYRGPFIEYLAVDDFKEDAKPWKQFFSAQDSVHHADGRGFDVPISIDALAERMDENLVYYLGNYLRVGLFLLLICTYLRPKSVLGIAVLGYNVYWNQGVLGSREAGRTNSGSADVSKQNSVIMLVTWLIMIYSKCMPIIALSLVLSLAVIVLHAGLRRSHSEGKFRGKLKLSYSFRSVWTGMPRESRKIFREIVDETRGGFLQASLMARRWLKYYLLSFRDKIRMKRYHR